LDALSRDFNDEPNRNLIGAASDSKEAQISVQTSLDPFPFILKSFIVDFLDIENAHTGFAKNREDMGKLSRCDVWTQEEELLFSLRWNHQVHGAYRYLRLSLSQLKSWGFLLNSSSKPEDKLA